jgi:hypothetical protein
VAFREVLPYLSLEPFRRCWYTQFLVALKESALPAPGGPTDVVYRFLYLPTFRPAISVRIERRDSIRMTVSQTEGWGGYDPKGLAWTRTIRLPLPAWDSLELALAAAHFWSDTVPEGPGGLDGSRCILEGVGTHRRVLVDHCSPQEVGPDTAFRGAGKLGAVGVPNVSAAAEDNILLERRRPQQGPRSSSAIR